MSNQFLYNQLYFDYSIAVEKYPIPIHCHTILPRRGTMGSAAVQDDFRFSGKKCEYHRLRKNKPDLLKELSITFAQLCRKYSIQLMFIGGDSQITIVVDISLREGMMRFF